MFERFTAPAREVVVRAQAVARSLSHGWIGTEHLFLAALGDAGAPGVAGLGRIGVTEASVLGALGELVGNGDQQSLGQGDADALRTLGIDLEEVRRQVEDAFGPGTLDPTGRGPGRRRFRRRCAESGPGRLPMTPKAKCGLSESLREALDRGDRELGVEHLLLGLLSVPDGLVVQLLARLGVTPEAARTAVRADLDAAA